MTNKSACFKSDKTDWETPQDLYDHLDAIHRFTCDVAADDNNHKHDNYYTIETDGLSQKWQGVCWCNPPYGRDAGKWIEKAHNEAQNGVKTVMLLPARTDVKWFHRWIYGRYNITFLPGRLKFSGSKDSAPFPSMIVVFERVF